MTKARLLVVAALAVDAALGFGGCDVSTFNVSLADIQCLGLTQVPGVASPADCAAACCAMPPLACTMYEWCPPGAGCPLPSTCWIGASTDCVAGKGWAGGARPTPPPPPPPPAQDFWPLSPGRPASWALDLAAPSGGGWTLAIDGGASRDICVPCGGYNSDAQAPPYIQKEGVAEAAVYSRLVTVPDGGVPTGGTLVLELLDCTYGGEVYVDGDLLGSHAGPFMPWAVDATGALSGRPAGSVFNLTVVSRPWRAYNGSGTGTVPTGFTYPETWLQPPNGFSSRLGVGLTRGLRLAAYPSLVVIEDVHVRTSVTSASLAAIVTLRNVGAADADVDVSGALGPWADQPGWPYPALPPVRAHVPAGAAVDVTLAAPWPLPPTSFWWPNRPYNASYIATLHWLNVTAAAAAGGAHVFPRRFGFVQHGECGKFFCVNGARVNEISDATPEAGMSDFSAYTASVAFNTSAGARDTWRRYMRLGMTTNRVHQSTPNEAMLDAADEVGFLLKPETAVRGCPGYEPCTPGTLFTQAVAELARVGRAHPSVHAYSVENESDKSVIPPLIDALVVVDPDRPLTWEGGTGRVAGATSGRSASGMSHYSKPPLNTGDIVGVGECAWCNANGLEMWASWCLEGRVNSYAYCSGWDTVNYWSNFLEGMSANRSAWQQQPCQARDRTDGVDGWGSPVVDWVQRAMHPFLALDADYFLRIAGGANGIYAPGWPLAPPNVTAGDTLSRNVTLFAETLSDVALVLTWSAHWDSATGPLVAQGASPPLALGPGENGDATVSFVVPSPGGAPGSARPLFLVLASGDAAAGAGAPPLYVEDRIFWRALAR